MQIKHYFNYERSLAQYSKLFFYLRTRTYLNKNENDGGTFQYFQFYEVWKH